MIEMKPRRRESPKPPVGEKDAQAGREEVLRLPVVNERRAETEGERRIVSTFTRARNRMASKNWMGRFKAVRDFYYLLGMLEFYLEQSRGARAERRELTRNIVKEIVELSRDRDEMVRGEAIQKLEWLFGQSTPVAAYLNENPDIKGLIEERLREVRE